MSAPADDFPLPPRPCTAAGVSRRLGVEIEFAGLDVAAAAAVVPAELGGLLEVISPYEQKVRDTELGDFGIELDFAFLKRQGRQLGPTTGHEGPFERQPERLLAEVAQRLVPVEVVSPPFAMERLGRLEPLVTRLRAAGAEGTRGSPLFAFGLHYNPELPDLSAATITAYLRAYVCLYPWLLANSDVDWTRRLLPYVDAFPDAYVDLVIAAHYAPTLDQLIDDYLVHNPDRNRSLDLLPLFAELDAERVRAVVDDPRIKPRPTLHYRLANCDIDRPGWGLRRSWRLWLDVERLACDAPRLTALAAGYVAHRARAAGSMDTDWLHTCERCLHDAGR